MLSKNNSNRLEHNSNRLRKEGDRLKKIGKLLRRDCARIEFLEKPFRTSSNAFKIISVLIFPKICSKQIALWITMKWSKDSARREVAQLDLQFSNFESFRISVELKSIYNFHKVN